MPDADLPTPISAIFSYHAHVYYDAETTRSDASLLRDHIAERFAVQLGRWHDRPIGPHPRAMYQIAFAIELFPALVPWLMLNRRGLAILVHPNTDRPRDDHLTHALWMGEMLPLDGSRLPLSLREAGGEHEPVVPNTTPLG